MRLFLILIIIFSLGITACENRNNSAPDNSGVVDPNDSDPNDNDPDPVKPDPNKPDPDKPVLGQYDYAAYFAETAPTIDGNGNDPAWEKAEWKPIAQVWMAPGSNGNANETVFSPTPSSKNFYGRYKIIWTEDRLYYLAEITDNILVHGRDPYVNPENDDCLELFINSNGKGGNHVANNTAIAYHMKLDEENAMDYVSGQQNVLPFRNGFIKRNHHLKYRIGNLDLPNRRSIDGTNEYTWEVEMKIYPDTLPVNDNPDTSPPAVPEKLSEGKVLRFAVAYCDADAKGQREYFMGSVFIDENNFSNRSRNQAYLTADVYAKLYLVK
ncbi:MAG: CBM9 family sugar-binding protein [Treponema sp.]|nr:CBM9 family sugar-binding protein [Treponema sp.]